MIRGVFPVLPTLFDDDGVIDAEAMRAVTQFALDAGAHGIVFPGVASEYNFLTPEERGELITVVQRVVDGRVPIVGGASAPTAGEVIAAGQQAIDRGISHLMIMAPAGLGDDLPAHQEFFENVSAQLGQAEIILQNAPTPIGAGLGPDQLAEIVGVSDSITYLKEETLPSGPVITKILSLAIPHLQGVLGGGGSRYLIDELDRGAMGTIPAVELTDLHVAIFEAHANGEHQQARDLYRDSLPLLVSQMIYRMRLTKYVLGKRGIIDRPFVRAPLPELDELSRQNIDTMLDDLNRTLNAVSVAQH